MHALGHPGTPGNHHALYISDTGKSRRFGFHEFVDTDEMLFRLWDQYRAARVLPTY